MAARALGTSRGVNGLLEQEGVVRCAALEVERWGVLGTSTRTRFALGEPGERSGAWSGTCDDGDVLSGCALRHSASSPGVLALPGVEPRGRWSGRVQVEGPALG